MRIDATKPLFAWECLDDSPSLATLKEFLAAIPDGQRAAKMAAYNATASLQKLVDAASAGGSQ